MKKSILFVLIAILLFTLTACSTKYPFFQPATAIQKIEIVNINNDDCEVVKTLSDEEKEQFISKFNEIKFKPYWFGDPMEVSGIAVKITYENDSYDYSGYYWSERYIQEKKIFIRKYCDKDTFYNLIKEFARIPKMADKNDNTKNTSQNSVEKGERTDLSDQLKYITKDAETLNEYIAGFERFCHQVDSGDEEEICFLETGNYDFRGENEFYFSLVRQYKANENDDEYMQVHMDIIFEPIKPNRQSQIWSDEFNSYEDFFKEIASSKILKYITDNHLKPKRIDFYENET